jgi:hypothetical protein
MSQRPNLSFTPHLARQSGTASHCAIRGSLRCGSGRWPDSTRRRRWRLWLRSRRPASRTARALRLQVKKAVSVVSDFAPGYDSETYFKDRFTQAGGEVSLALRVPLQNPDFAPYLQRVRDTAPDGLFVFVPAGQAGIFVRQFVERGLDKTGIRLFGAGDITDDDLLSRRQGNDTLAMHSSLPRFLRLPMLRRSPFRSGRLYI